MLFRRHSALSVVLCAALVSAPVSAAAARKKGPRKPPTCKRIPPGKQGATARGSVPKKATDLRRLLTPRGNGHEFRMPALLEEPPLPFAFFPHAVTTAPPPQSLEPTLDPQTAAWKEYDRKRKAAVDRRSDRIKAERMFLAYIGLGGGGVSYGLHLVAQVVAPDYAWVGGAVMIALSVPILVVGGRRWVANLRFFDEAHHHAVLPEPPPFPRPDPSQPNGGK